jgi:hypothetical protein
VALGPFFFAVSKRSFSFKNENYILYSKGLVASRSEDEALELQVVRGTTVLQDHEQAMIQLCNDESTTDKDAERCIINYLKESYADVDDGLEPTDCVQDDIDCLIDDMYNRWHEESKFTPTTTSPMNEADSASPLDNKVKPWSSRSSPSGTYVRDPATGKMENIEAQ